MSRDSAELSQRAHQQITRSGRMCIALCVFIVTSFEGSAAPRLPQLQCAVPVSNGRCGRSLHFVRTAAQNCTHACPLFCLFKLSTANCCVFIKKKNIRSQFFTSVAVRAERLETLVQQSA
jgi:hypothetical protein